MSDFILRQRDGAVLIATLNRPDERNAISTPEQVDEIVDFCAEVTADSSVRAVILTGAGTAFCAGGNVKNMRDRTGMFAGSPYELRNNYRTGIQRIPLALYELEVPVVAAINGAAIGAGLDLACMCDVRIATTRAIFAESFVKLGIIPGDGGALLLQRVIGQARAALMTLTGDNIDAQQALEFGLLAEVVNEEDLIPAALRIAHRIASNPGHSLRLAKRLLREAQDMKLGPLLELSAAYQALAHHTEDHEEALRAGLERRPGIFHGK